jgi:predicted dehydrogenase
VNRRDFVGQAARSGAVSFTAASFGRISGANDRVNIGLIGCGGRGPFVARFMAELPTARFTALADVYLPQARKAQAWAGADTPIHQDFRQLLERRDVDAVLVATSDHWHGMATVLACQAGKHVYVEKPLAYSVREGRAIVNAARRYQRIVQVGTQHRSSPHFAELADLVRSGGIGEVRLVRVWNFTNLTPRGIGDAPDSPVPDELDWDMYLGPAPEVPFNEKRFLRTYRFFFDYAGGYITDFGTHRFDTIHQVMGQERPLSVSATGGRYSVKGAGDVPDVMQVTYEYPGFVMTYEACQINAHGLGGRTAGMNYYSAAGEEDRPHGMAFYGTEGTIFADRIGYDIYPEVRRRAFFETSGAAPALTASAVARRSQNVRDATRTHAQAFVEAVRLSKPPVIDIEEGHRATLIAHLGNIAFKTGHKLRWDSENEVFFGKQDANQLLARAPRARWDLIK